MVLRMVLFEKVTVEIRIRFLQGFQDLHGKPVHELWPLQVHVFKGIIFILLVNSKNLIYERGGRDLSENIHKSI